MFRAKIRIDHKHCWVSAISKKYSCKLYLTNTASIKPGITSDILYIKADEEIQDQIISFITENKSIQEFDILEKNSNEMFLLVIIAGNSTIIEKILHNKCFLLEPTMLIDGYEFWQVGSSDRAFLQELLTDLKKVGDVELMSAVPYSFDRSTLTPKQKAILNSAYINGYYEYPRKVESSQLAELANISKSTLIEHLRKAEVKIIKDFIESR